MDKGYPRLLVSAEIPAEAEMHRRKERVKGVGAQIGAARRQHRRIPRKQPHQRLRQELAVERTERAPAHGDQQTVTQRSPCALRLVRPHILRRDRGNRGEECRGHQKQEADQFLHDPHSRGDHKSPAVGDHRDHDKRHLNQPVLTGNGRAHLENLCEYLPVYADIRLCHPEPQIPSAEHKKCERHAHRLPEYRCKRRTRRAHPAAYENKIEHDIHRTCHRHEIHGSLRIARPAENAADHIVCRDKGHPGKTDAQIQPRLLHRLRGRKHNTCN